MRTYTIPNWLRLGVPRSCQGQTVEVRYGIDLANGYAVRCTYDRSDCIEVWAIAELTDDEMDALECYDAGGADEPPAVSGEWEVVEFEIEEI